MNTLIEAESKSKYKEKKRLTQELKENESILYSKTKLYFKDRSKLQTTQNIKRKMKKWSTTHTKKIEKPQTENLFIKLKDVSDRPIRIKCKEYSY